MRAPLSQREVAQWEWVRTLEGLYGKHTEDLRRHETDCLLSVPAAYTGRYGFKPSVARMPHAGLMGSHDGMDNIVGVVGPIAQSARDLELFCKTMLQYEAWILEHAVLEIPWQSNVSLPERLCFAILWDDDVVRPHPPLTRELARVKRALLAAGHEVIDWVPLDHKAGWDLIVCLLGEFVHRTCADQN